MAVVESNMDMSLRSSWERRTVGRVVRAVVESSGSRVLRLKVVVGVAELIGRVMVDDIG